MEKINRKFYIIFTICIILISASSVSFEMPNDTFFTIRMGEDVFREGISNADTLTFHEGLEFEHLRWAFDCLIAFIYNNFNFVGIYIFVVIMSVIISLTLFNILVSKKVNLLLAFVLVIFTILSVGAGLVARAQIVSYLLFLLEVYSVEKLIETEKKRYSVYLVIIAFLLVNFHASVFPVYFVLYMPYIAEYIMFKLKKKYDFIHGNMTEEKNEVTKKLTASSFNILVLLKTMTIAIAAGLLSPSFIASYTYMIKCMGAYSKNLILELQQIDVLGSFGFLVVICAFLVILLVDKIKIKVSDFCMIIGFIFLSFVAVRNVIILYLIVPICFSRIIMSRGEILDILPNEEDWREHVMYKITLALFTVILVITSCMNNYYTKFVNEKMYPVEATKYILENVDTENMRIFNHLNFGSYLELNYIKTFIDSRNEVYCDNFNDTKVLEDWDKTRSGKVSYKETFEKYGITHALLYKDEVINQYICDDEDYNLLYEDDYFVFYEKIKEERK